MIELNHVSGGYGHLKIVNNISLTFNDSQITVLLGPNGCGKSTLLNLCCSKKHIMDGAVIINGSPLSRLSSAEIAQRVSLLPQSRTVPDITVGSLVLHGRFPWLGYPRTYRTEDRAGAAKAMERLGILEKRHKLLAHLSGGERQKAYLAMLLAQNSQNILLDEPTTYLDISYQLELLTLLTELKQEGKCVVAVLHDLNMALEIADQVVVLKDGTLITVGTPEEIVSCGAVERAFGIRLQREERFGFKPL